MRSNYVRELASARKALDETSKANAKLEIDAKKHKTRNDELEMRNRQLVCFYFFFKFVRFFHIICIYLKAFRILFDFLTSIYCR